MESCLSCKNFLSFKQLFNDLDEPSDRGICLINPLFFGDDTVRFAIVDVSHSCDNHEPRDSGGEQ